MDKTFDVVASDIIQESIKSAIFIDDRVLLPFQKSTEGDIDYSELLAPFEERGCTLSLYRFDQTWSKRTNFLFDNRDLLILDWQLQKNQDTYPDTLKVLQEAIRTDSLHFCCIYTDTNPADFENKIIFPILFYFGYCVQTNKEELQAAKLKFEEYCDNDGLDSEQIIAELNPLLREFLLYSFDNAKKTELTKDILNFLQSRFKDFNAIRNSIRTLSVDLGHALALLAYSFDNSSIPFGTDTYTIRINKSSKGGWRLYINNTIITIANKDAIQEQTFYDEFKNSLVDEHNIFLTLLGLEMRNSFRKGSGFIGKDLNEISETAFFYHNKNIKPQSAFYEFLRQLWVDQATHFLHANEPLLYSTIEEYKSISSMEEKVKDFEDKIPSDKKYQHDLIKLNIFYNQLRFSPNEHDVISFGDVFKFQTETNSFDYLICISPLCDCADSTKIDNQFLFVKQQNTISSYEKALKGAEGQYISYLMEADKIICIDWGVCKPFSLYVESAKLLSMSPISYLNKTLSLSYVGRIKENFAQRIANRALSYPARVGVSLAQIS